METRTEAMKPFFLKAGIPLALSAAGCILARMLSKRGPHFDSSMINVHQDSTDEESFHSFNSNSDTCTECDDQQIQDFEVELSLLRGKVDDLGIKGRELETHFLKYMDMKEKESKVIEIGSALSVEKIRAEFLGQEVSLIMEYLKVLKLVEGIKKENRRLCTKVKRKLHVIKELNSKINAMERELSKNLMELEMKANVIQELNDEISSLKGVVEQLQHEKFEVASNKEVAETSASSELKVE